jgi:predicted nucleotidyltransferase/uncharacterized protein (UPF0332 family)
MAEKNSKEENIEIPEMELSKYSNNNSPQIPQSTEKEKKEIDKTKKELEKIKNYIIKKYSFIKSISILPPPSINEFVEEEIGEREKEVPAEEFDKLLKKIHLMIIVPDEKEKEIPKIRRNIIEQIEKLKQDVWVHIKCVGEIWEMGFDSKFELISAVAVSFPLYDKGLLGALRVAEIHKSLVLKKFEKYVVSYCIGGSLVRGEAEKTSDVDVFVIINDTDVKRMSRRELLERLRGIIYQYITEANAYAGSKNKLEPQIYLLTDFWDAVKDAHPIMFTFIRDGVPLYDRGTFMPWKALLRMGKLKPSPEAIDMFMSMGDGVISRNKKILLSDVFSNIFWGITTPAQAIVMLNGGAPPHAKKELVREFKKEFLDKKMIEKKHVDFLEKVVQTWKDYEHEKITEISGTEIDKMLKDAEEFINRLKELRKEIEKKSQEKIIEQAYTDLMELMKEVVGKKSQSEVVREFEENFVRKGKFSRVSLRILNDVIKARQEYKKGKMNIRKIDLARRDADILIKDLIEYTQKKDLINLEKGRMTIKFEEKGKSKTAELINTKGQSFIIRDNIIEKITDKIELSNSKELSDVLSQQKSRNVEIDPQIFELLKKKLGNFEIVL